MNKLSNILFIIIFLIIAACTERIDIDLQGQDYLRLVVEGNLTTDTMAHQVILTKTTDFSHNTAPPPISDASVEIVDQDGNIHMLQEKPANSGIYETQPDYYAIIGNTYTLNINLQEEIDDHKFYTASSKVPNINPIDSIQLELHEDWGSKGYLEVKCYYLDPVSKDFYMFNIFKNGVLLTDTLSNRMVVDDEFYNGNNTNGIGVGYLNQAIGKEKVYPGDIITFQAGSISEGYANFIWAVQVEVSFSTPMFSGPPANVKGNISNGAIGYFAAYSTKYSSKKY